MPVELHEPSVVLALVALSVGLLAVVAWLVRGPPADCHVVDVNL